MDVPQKVTTQAKAASSPEASSPDKTLPPARVVLPAMTDEASAASVSAPVPPIQAAIPPAPQPKVTPKPEAQLVSGKDVQDNKQDLEKEKQASRQAEAEKQQAEPAEQHKKAKERERRHRRYADRARQDAARQQQQEQQEQQQQEVRQNTDQFGILAFDRSDEPPTQTFFGD